MGLFDAGIFMDRARLQQAQPTPLDRLAQGFQMAQQKQQMDLQRRQLEAKANEVDYEGLASNALYKAAIAQKSGQSYQMSPQELAAIEVVSITKNTGVQFDPVSKEYIKVPTFSDRAAAYTGGRQQPMNRLAAPVVAPDAFSGPALEDMPMGGLMMPASSGPYRDDLGVQPMDINAIEQSVAPDANRRMPQKPKVTGPLAGTRRAVEMETEADIEQQKADYKTLREKIAGMPKSQQRLVKTYDTITNINNKIDKAINQVGPYTSGAGSVFSVLPGTPAKDLQKTLETLQADSAFGALQEMRDNSPTGGALGSITERELALLGSAQQALTQDQSAAQLKENLTAYKDIRNKAFENVLTAYEQDYGAVPDKIKKMFETPKTETAGQPSALPQDKKKRLQELRAKRDAGTLK